MANNLTERARYQQTLRQILHLLNPTKTLIRIQDYFFFKFQPKKRNNATKMEMVTECKRMRKQHS